MKKCILFVALFVFVGVALGQTPAPQGKIVIYEKDKEVALEKADPSFWGDVRYKGTGHYTVRYIIQLADLKPQNFLLAEDGSLYIIVPRVHLEAPVLKVKDTEEHAAFLRSWKTYMELRKECVADAEVTMRNEAVAQYSTALLEAQVNLREFIRAMGDNIAQASKAKRIVVVPDTAPLPKVVPMPPATTAPKKCEEKSKLEKN